MEEQALELILLQVTHRGFHLEVKLLFDCSRNHNNATYLISRVTNSSASLTFGHGTSVQNQSYITVALANSYEWKSFRTCFCH